MNGEAHFKQHTVDATACEMHLLNYYRSVSDINPPDQRISRNMSTLSLVTDLSALNSALLVHHDIITKNSQAH